MAYTIKQYSGDAQATTLAVAVGPADATIQGANLTNWPDGSVGPFVVDLNLGGATEEKILCSSRSGNVLTVAASGRGYDGTVAAAHSAGEALNHVITAVDMAEANAAVLNTIGRVTSLGDLIVASAANTFARLGVGTTGQVLTVAGGTAAWSAPASSVVLASAAIAGGQTISSAVYADFPSGAVATTFVVPASGKVKFSVELGLSSTTVSDGLNLGIFATAGANTGNTPAGSLGAATPAVLSLGAGTTVQWNVTGSMYITGLSPGSSTFTLRCEKVGSNNVASSTGLFLAEVG